VSAGPSAPDPGPTVVRAAAMPAGTPSLPVAIVGAGACGLTAAILLRDAGVDCVLLERDAVPQGSTALSSGFVPAAGTAVQRAAGVADDSPARFAADIQAKAKGRAAPHLVRAYTEAIAPALDALQARHGLAFELLDGFLYPGHSVRRMHALRERTGAALVGALATAAESAGATLLTDALVRELWCDADGRVIGLGLRRPDGSVEHLACEALLLACNGFGGNRSLVAELLPALADAAFAGHAGNDGSAIAWARALGLRLADLGGCQGHGSWAVPQGVLVTWALMTEGAVQVNARGQRFHDETGGYSEAAVAVLAQPGGVAWNVFDERLRALGRGFPDFRDAEAAGAVKRFDDAAALAAHIGCDAETLARTLAGARRPLAPPLYAVKVTGALFHTQGGIDVDAACRALRPTAGRTPTCWRPAAPRAASRATPCGATCPATGC
jgi:fumarate reductase flavoprotein subunit